VRDVAALNGYGEFQEEAWFPQSKYHCSPDEIISTLMEDRLFDRFLRHMAKDFARGRVARAPFRFFSVPHHDLWEQQICTDVRTIRFARWSALLGRQ
jgi:hypothetical protein